MLKRIRIALVIVGLGLVGCDKDQVNSPDEQQENLLVALQATYGNENLLLDHSYTTSEGYIVQFTDIKCFFSSIKNGSSSLSEAALFDYRNKGTSLLNLKGNHSDFNQLTCFVGVDPIYNHDDPTLFPADHPLNINNADDMHWSWSPGYVFVKIEAKVDTLVDLSENLNQNVVFHIGMDDYLQILTLTSLNWQQKSAGMFESKWKLDMEKFLQNGTQIIDLKTENSTHSSSGEEALTLKVIENFRDAISLY